MELISSDAQFSIVIFFAFAKAIIPPPTPPNNFLDVQFFIVIASASCFPPVYPQ